MMKNLLRFLMTLFLLLGGLVMSVSASSYGFSTDELSEEEVSRRWNNLNLKSISAPDSIDSINTPLKSFDVNEKGLVILALQGERIAIVREKQVLRYFSFSHDGAYYVMWNGDNILLFLERGDSITEFTQEGQLINMIRVTSHDLHNDTLWRKQTQKRKQIEIGGFTYRMQNKMGILNIFSDSYGQLVKISEDGTETLLYNNSSQLARAITIVSCFFVFFAVVIVTIILRAKEAKAIT